MARWGDHKDSVKAARQHIAVDHGHINLPLSALVRAECTARAVPTSAAERAANLKGPGLSTARRDAIHYYYYYYCHYYCHYHCHYYSAVLGTPPPVDEDAASLSPNTNPGCFNRGSGFGTIFTTQAYPGEAH